MITAYLSSDGNNARRCISYKYQENRHPSAVTDPLLHTSHYLYGEYDHLCAVINRCGITVAAHTSDQEGRVVKQVMAEDGAVNKYRYNTNKNMTKYIDPLSRITVIKRMQNRLSEEIGYPVTSSLAYRYDCRYNMLLEVGGLTHYENQRMAWDRFEYDYDPGYPERTRLVLRFMNIMS